MSPQSEVPSVERVVIFFSNIQSDTLEDLKPPLGNFLDSQQEGDSCLVSSSNCNSQGQRGFPRRTRAIPSAQRQNWIQPCGLERSSSFPQVPPCCSLLSCFLPPDRFCFGLLEINKIFWGSCQSCRTSLWAF